jgi:hypothetical protein
LRAIREIGRLAHVGGFNDWAVLPEESIVVSQVVREDFVEAANQRKPWRALR